MFCGNIPLLSTEQLLSPRGSIMGRDLLRSATVDKIKNAEQELEAAKCVF